MQRVFRPRDFYGIYKAMSRYCGTYGTYCCFTRYPIPSKHGVFPKHNCFCTWTLLVLFFKCQKRVYKIYTHYLRTWYTCHTSRNILCIKNLNSSPHTNFILRVTGRDILYSRRIWANNWIILANFWPEFGKRISLHDYRWVWGATFMSTIWFNQTEENLHDVH